MSVAAAQALTEQLRQAVAGHQPKFRRLVLHEHRDRIGENEHPQQQIAVARTGRQVCRDVTRVDVGDSGDKRWTEQQEGGWARRYR